MSNKPINTTNTSTHKVDPSANRADWADKLSNDPTQNTFSELRPSIERKRASGRVFL